MKPRSEFLNHVADLLSNWAPVIGRSMFGGYAFFREGVIFGFVADDVLYLRTDEASRPEFTARGLGPFVFRSKSGVETEMTYYEAPAEALDEPEAMQTWAGLAWQAAQRQVAARRPREGRS